MRLLKRDSKGRERAAGDERVTLAYVFVLGILVGVGGVFFYFAVDAHSGKRRRDHTEW